MLADSRVQSEMHRAADTREAAERRLRGDMSREAAEQQQGLERQMKRQRDRDIERAVLEMQQQQEQLMREGEHRYR